MGKGANTRDRIVDKALRVASVEGLEGVTLGRLATDIGMSKSGLFAHFNSKEALQIDVLTAAAQRFREVVVAPALAQPRGEPRVRAIFDRWLGWPKHDSLPGGCIFVQAAAELDDRPGPVRDALVAFQRDWAAALKRAAQIAIDEGHFRPDTDPELFAFQLWSIVLGYYQASRLFRDPRADERAHRAFEALLASVRTR